MTYLYTDTHIGHLKLERTGQRPAGFSELIIERWRETVRDGDLVTHLGDVAFHSDTQLARITELPGRKILVRGNHDTKSLPQYMERGFQFACDTFTMRLEGIRILEDGSSYSGIYMVNGRNWRACWSRYSRIMHRTRWYSLVTI